MILKLECTSFRTRTSRATRVSGIPASQSVVSQELCLDQQQSKTGFSPEGIRFIIFICAVVFNLTESQVIILGRLENLKKGDSVFAVYPDTTSFYQATVVQPPRKVAGGGSFVMVNFVDDQDEHGITHDKAVLLKHIMLPP
jgi:hypothetical protein